MQMTSSHKAVVKNHNYFLANNFVAIIHLFEYNKYHIFTFLLETLPKKVCSVSFVSQYILSRRIRDGSAAETVERDCRVSEKVSARVSRLMKTVLYKLHRYIN